MAKTLNLNIVVCLLLVCILSLNKEIQSCSRNRKQRDEFLPKVGEALNLPAEKMVKDLDLYRGNLEKMVSGTGCY